jgi:hypothetical protein
LQIQIIPFTPVRNSPIFKRLHWVFRASSYDVRWRKRGRRRLHFVLAILWLLNIVMKCLRESDICLCWIPNLPHLPLPESDRSRSVAEFDLLWKIHISQKMDKTFSMRQDELIGAGLGWSMRLRPESSCESGECVGFNIV